MAAVAQALAREVAPKPMLLRLLAFFLSFYAVVAALVFGMSAISGNGTYKIGDVPVSREQFMEQAGPMLALLPAIVVLAAFAGWSLYSERRWGRHAVVALFVIAFTGSTLVGAADSTSRAQIPIQLVLSAVVVAPLIWYLYRKATVVRYYATLDRRP